MSEEFHISFEGIDPGEAGNLAQSLRDELLDADPTVRVERRRDDPNAMDFGATLVLVLGTSAATALSNGIAVWLARNSGVSLQIKKNGTTLVAKHINSKNAAELASVFAVKR